ncbi:sentrin-specific protease 5 [Drosophila biarmipes]|uniref:sentrin-specific protease 5 n=1 Tax=Drosophila biarmipes TaxID=125945 RepID=UPI0007E6360D|nr:sentrin-specific protease 5 [Drosophila biarmipes]
MDTMAKQECGNQPNSDRWQIQANNRLMALEAQAIERERYLNLLRKECGKPKPHSLQSTRPEIREFKLNRSQNSYTATLANGKISLGSNPKERVEDIILALERILIFTCKPSGKNRKARHIAIKSTLDQPKRKSTDFVVKCVRHRRHNSSVFLRDDYAEQFRKRALQKSKKLKIHFAEALSNAKRAEDERRALEQDMRRKFKNCGLIPESIVTIEDKSEENKVFAQLTKPITISEKISENKSDENEPGEFDLPNEEFLNHSEAIIISEDELEENEEFVQLTKEHLNRFVELEEGHPEQVVVTKFKLDVHLSDIKILIGDRWLNDVIINFYMNLMIERSEKRSGQLPSVYSMNTFFMPRLLQSGYAGVKRWTRRVDIFKKDIILIPVHCSSVHWTMAIIDMRRKTILYYDSKGGANQNLLGAVEKYLWEESLDKRKQPFDTSTFRIEKARNVPHQKNNTDCGVFSCMFAEYVTRNAPITFSQDNMVYFRKKIALEIIDGELWN